jgi:hypothetical protein
MARGFSKMSPQLVADALSMLAAGETLKTVAAKYGVSIPCITGHRDRAKIKLTQYAVQPTRLTKTPPTKTPPPYAPPPYTPTPVADDAPAPDPDWEEHLRNLTGKDGGDFNTLETYVYLAQGFKQGINAKMLSDKVGFDVTLAVRPDYRKGDAYYWKTVTQRVLDELKPKTKLLAQADRDAAEDHAYHVRQLGEREASYKDDCIWAEKQGQPQPTPDGNLIGIRSLVERERTAQRNKIDPAEAAREAYALTLIPASGLTASTPEGQRAIMKLGAFLAAPVYGGAGPSIRNDEFLDSESAEFKDKDFVSDGQNPVSSEMEAQRAKEIREAQGVFNWKTGQIEYPK